MDEKLSITLFVDVLCIWAHIAQRRVEEVRKEFPGKVHFEFRFCSVFGDTAHKMDTVWKAKGGFEGFATHLQEVAGSYDYISLHDACWTTVRPASSIPAHLLLKTVEALDPEKFEPALLAMRHAFFDEGRDISNIDVLEGVLAGQGINVDELRSAVRSGQSHALLEADNRAKEAFGVQGSPTFILNQGRQKLYGNVGYRVIEANIQELLRAPVVDEASWC